MGLCVYCGEQAGFLRRVHSDCRKNFNEGRIKILSLIEMTPADPRSPDIRKKEIEDLCRKHRIDGGTFRQMLIEGWEKAVERALSDNLLSYEEEKHLQEFMKSFSLTQIDLNANDVFSRLAKGAALRDLSEGKIPDRIAIPDGLPFNLQKSETLIWIFPATAYYESKIRRSYEGGYSGVSVRVARGVYFRTGSFRGRPVEHEEIMPVDVGVMGATTKHIYFTGNSKSFRVRYDKIVSFVPYDDGIGFQRDVANAKQQIFKTGDGWFVYNLIVNAARI